MIENIRKGENKLDFSKFVFVDQWKMKVRIGDLTKIRTGKLDANAASMDGQYPFFTCSKEPLRISTYSYDCECVLVAGNGDLNVKYYNGKFDAYQRTYIIENNNVEKLYLPYLYYFLETYIEELKHGDILMTKTGRINTENSSLGRAALYLGEDDMANVNGHVYFIRLKPGVSNMFVLRILVSPEYVDLIRGVCVGGIDKRQLNKEHIEDFPIICPPTDMVNEYVKFVCQVDKSKVVVQKALDEAQILFDSLMQKYFG